MRDLPSLDVARIFVVAIPIALGGIVLAALLAQAGVVAVPRSSPSPTPTPSRDPGAFWKVEGVVLDAETRLPLAGACVRIGPRECQPNQPHTDAQGRYSFEIPAGVMVDYELHFERAGYVTQDVRLRAAGDRPDLVIFLEKAR